MEKTTCLRSDSKGPARRKELTEQGRHRTTVPRAQTGKTGCDPECQGRGWLFQINRDAAAAANKYMRTVHAAVGTCRHVPLASIYLGKWAVRPPVGSKEKKEVLGG